MTVDDHNKNLTDALATMYDAGATRVPPWLALTSALASIRPDSVDATIEWLQTHREQLGRAHDEGRAARLQLAQVPAEMQYAPELGFLDRTRDDHALRERYLFADMVGRRSFFQTAIYAITGLELGTEDATMLEHIASASLAIDRRAWPLAATRRVAARGGGFAAATVAGQAMMGSSVLAGNAAAGCARFLHRALAVAREGGSVRAMVATIVADGGHVMGFGRPFVGYDERAPIMQALLARRGRDQLPFVTLLREAEAAFASHKGLRSNAAAWAAAILSDFGMSPEQVHAVCHFWVSVCVYAHASFAGERGLVTPASP